MNKKRVYGVGLAALTILLLLSICSLAKLYTKDRPTKMVYRLRDNESIVEVAQRFNVNPKDIRYDDGYLMFTVK